MSMSTGGGSGGRRSTLSEINVTPLVDVMLVLLIVFMVTTPIIIEDNKPREVDVDLPNTSSKKLLDPTEIKQLIVTAGLDYRLTLPGDADKPALELADCSAAASAAVATASDPDYAACLQPLEDKLKANPKVQDEKKLFLQADRRLPYGFVVDVMAHARNAGVTGLGMVTNPPGGGGSSAGPASAAPVQP